MSLHHWIIAGLWLLFVAYWAVAGADAKRSVSPSKRRWRWEIGLRLVAILLIAALLQSRSLRQVIAETQRSVSHSRILGWTGVGLCLLGFGLAISARRHLGRNWGLPMSRREYFIYGARREEAVMLQLFPEKYAVYMARTGMFAPCPFRRG